MQKEIKDAYPKKVCHMLKRHVRKKKDAYPKKVCHMPTRHVHKGKKRNRKKREKDSPHPRKKKREIDHAKEFILYPPKIFHTLAPLDRIV